MREIEQYVFMWHKTKKRRGYRDSSTSGRLIVTWEDGPGRLGSPERAPSGGYPQPGAHTHNPRPPLNEPSPLKHEKGGFFPTIKEILQAMKRSFFEMQEKKNHVSVKTDMLAAQICTLSWIMQTHVSNILPGAAAKTPSCIIPRPTWPEPNKDSTCKHTPLHSTTTRLSLQMFWFQGTKK